MCRAWEVRNMLVVGRSQLELPVLLTSPGPATYSQK